MSEQPQPLSPPAAGNATDAGAPAPAGIPPAPPENAVPPGPLPDAPALGGLAPAAPNAPAATVETPAEHGPAAEAPPAAAAAPAPPPLDPAPAPEAAGQAPASLAVEVRADAGGGVAAAPVEEPEEVLPAAFLGDPAEALHMMHLETPSEAEAERLARSRALAAQAAAEARDEEISPTAVTARFARKPRASAASGRASAAAAKPEAAKSAAKIALERKAKVIIYGILVLLFILCVTVAYFRFIAKRTESPGSARPRPPSAASWLCSSPPARQRPIAGLARGPEAPGRPAAQIADA